MFFEIKMPTTKKDDAGKPGIDNSISHRNVSDVK